jgi:para-aminobenzoate synthetase/4-amino-4-deoxychorismate lyase
MTPLGPPAAVILRPVIVPGGLGPHKWRDRRLLESHEGDDPATLPLLLDADGHVLETSRTSIVVRARDGTLHTPPRDGRILPGVTAALAGAEERPLTLADLQGAAAVYVASALRGLQPASATDNVAATSPLGAPDCT